MRINPRRQLVLRQLLAVAATAILAGCGSTRTSNTMRTATEQLLISDAIDRTVDGIDFTPLAGQTVYFDDARLTDVVDKGYLVSSLRQHMLASGCVLKERREDAAFVVETRAGAVGTDNHDLLFGVPAIQLPQVPVASAMPAAIPEIPFAKRRDQRGVAKVAVFAYRRSTGEPVWQSGIVINKSTANDIWVFGAGPFQRGTIYDNPQFAGKRLVGGDDHDLAIERNEHIASVNDEAVFADVRQEPSRVVRDDAIRQATAITPVPAAAPSGDGPPVLPPPRPLSEAPPPEGQLTDARLP
jgi:hypothetical protein